MVSHGTARKREEEGTCGLFTIKGFQYQNGTMHIYRSAPGHEEWSLRLPQDCILEIERLKYHPCTALASHGPADTYLTGVRQVGGMRREIGT